MRLELLEFRGGKTPKRKKLTGALGAQKGEGFVEGRINRVLEEREGSQCAKKKTLRKKGEGRRRKRMRSGRKKRTGGEKKLRGLKGVLKKKGRALQNLGLATASSSKVN